MANKFIGIRVPAELKERLRGEATAKGVSLSAVLRAYLENEWVDESPAIDLAKERKRIEDDPSNLNVTLDDGGALVAKEAGKPPQ